MNLTEAFARPRVEVDQITGELKEMFANHSFSGSEKIGLAVSVIITESQKAFEEARAARVGMREEWKFDSGTMMRAHQRMGRQRLDDLLALLVFGGRPCLEPGSQRDRDH